MFRWYLFCNILSFCWDFANNPLFIWDLQICVICIQKNQDFNKTKILSFYLGPSHLRTTKKQSIPPGSFQDNFRCQCFEGCNKFRCCTCHHQCEHVTPLPFWRQCPPTGQGNDRGRTSQQFANVRQGHRQSFLRVPTIYNFTSLSAYLMLYPVLGHQVWNWTAGGSKQAFAAMPAWHCQGI